MVLPQVKELENIELNQCIVLLLEEEDKGLQQHLALVGAFQPDKVKYLNAHTAINVILEIADG